MNPEQAAWLAIAVVLGLVAIGAGVSYVWWAHIITRFIREAPPMHTLTWQLEQAESALRKIRSITGDAGNDVFSHNWRRVKEVCDSALAQMEETRKRI